jgi:hypothetical protein
MMQEFSQSLARIAVWNLAGFGGIEVTRKIIRGWRCWALI